MRPRSSAVEVVLEVADDVLLDEVGEEAAVHVVHDRRGEREQRPRQCLELLGDLEAGDAVAQQGLVDVEVDEAHLGVGHLRERLTVDARELLERLERQPRVEDRRHVVEEHEVALGDALERLRAEAEGQVQPGDERRLEARPARGLLEADVPLGVGGWQQVVEVADGEAPRGGRVADLGRRAAAVAQARDHPRVGDRGRRPEPVRGRRHEPVARPAAQRRGRDPDAARRLSQRHPGAHGVPTKLAAGPLARLPPLAGLTSRDVGRRRASRGRRLAGGEPPTRRPCAWFGAEVIRAAPDACQRQPLRLKPSGAGTRPPRSPASARGWA
jgi:hypothetical protein